MIKSFQVFDMQQEINASISQGPTDPLLDISAADLESELNDILESDTASDMETDLSRMLGAQSLSDKGVCFGDFHIISLRIKIRILTMNRLNASLTDMFNPLCFFLYGHE